ncbi:M48 family metallopeptidase [Leptothermofonsia sichuanensis E412]|uniref:M48 family metallopeptidase n=1 Tax=Leptothermofonsia sichuanensis TaxID=2917832 RepID=UPI001CA736B9|nr:M48 family metallopeptidase [Leptothermofonsia sichuanensis]QZZ22544.1 M48 family metallopeptidase [Leptothermofonsia sichuanensis E412]
MSLLKTPLLGLRADHFRHPLDLQATENLKQLPGFDMVIRNLLGPLAEQVFYLDNIASSVLVSEKQLPDLHRLLLEACRTLDLEPPQLYIRQHPAPNAYTFAMRGKRPFIVVHTSLVDLLTPEEIQAVIAHELGHLKCDHGVYLTLANILIQLASLGGLAQGLQAQLMEWVRCAEFTCDRAALLATQNPKVVASVLMKLSGGSPKLSAQLNLEAFLEQARAYDDISNDQLGAMLKQAMTEQLTHPVPVLRAREIDRWSCSQEYQALLQSRPVQSYEHSDTRGGWRNW